MNNECLVRTDVDVTRTQIDAAGGSGGGQLRCVRLKRGIERGEIEGGGGGVEKWVKRNHDE